MGLESVPGIDRYCHQIWMQGESKIPDRFAPYCELWKKLHPGTEYILWTEESIFRLIKEKYSYLIDIWNSLPKLVLKIDIAKFCILESYGGWYCDVDMEPLKDIRPLLKGFEIVFSKSYFEIAKIVGGPGKMPFFAKYMINNALMASVPGHPFWPLCIQQLGYTTSLQRYDYTYASWILNIAGPELISRMYEHYTTRNPDHKIKIYSFDYFEPKLGLMYKTNKVKDKNSYKVGKDTHVVHYYTKSWLVEETSFMTNCIGSIVGLSLAMLLILLAIILALVIAYPIDKFKFKIRKKQSQESFTNEQISYRYRSIESALL